MPTRRYFLCVLLFQLWSCTSIPFKQPPPNDAQSLNAFPDQLLGSYYLNDTRNVNGKPLSLKHTECLKLMNALEIYRDSLVYHDYRAFAYQKTPRDSAILEVNDSLIALKEFGEVKQYPYITCGSQYIAIKNDVGSTFVLGDTVKLKQVGMYYFLSIQLKELWFALVFKNPQQGKLQWLTAMLHRDKQQLEKQIKAITPAIPAIFDGKETFCFNPGKREMLLMIQKGIYQLTMEFLRK